MWGALKVEVRSDDGSPEYTDNTKKPIGAKFDGTALGAHTLLTTK